MPTKEEEVDEATRRLKEIEDKILAAGLVLEEATRHAQQVENQIMAGTIALDDLLTQRIPSAHAELHPPTYPHVHKLYHRDPGHCLHKRGCGAAGTVQLHPTRLCRVCYPDGIVLHSRPTTVAGV